MRLLAASYADAEKANRAVEELIEAEFDSEEISLVVADSVGGHEVMVEHAIFQRTGATRVRG